MHPGQFYALPQSPQTFKQLLMVAGMDRYFQIVRCFRDEDLRADRQPEFTQIDCELSFVTREDVLQVFEAMTRDIFRDLIAVELPAFPRMTYDEAMRLYGSDKPDVRFGMPFVELTSLAKGQGFQVFDQSEIVLAINFSGGANYTRKQIDELTEWVRRPQIGAKGLVYVKYEPDNTYKSSIDKFFGPEHLRQWCQVAQAQPGDMLLILSGGVDATRKQLGELRLEIGKRGGLIPPGSFAPLWVLDFPLLEWNEEANRFTACHHPFTSPLSDDLKYMESKDRNVLSAMRAEAYDLVINGTEIGGGSIRIHDRAVQARNFALLGFTPEEAEAQFGFLLGAFEYGAPPHGGIAFGMDRFCAVMQGQTTIRDFIAFPKNNQGRDVMIDAPAAVDHKQLDELGLSIQV
jgi:aspartyl-tRNA synthetase